jgi:hypothetical protein
MILDFLNYFLYNSLLKIKILIELIFIRKAEYK